MNPMSAMPPWELPPDMVEYAETGEMEVIGDILRMFLESTQEDLERILAAIQSGDAATVERLGHGLKGGCAQIGAAGLARIAAEWELRGQSKERWVELAADFQSEFRRVADLIRAHPVFPAD